MDTVTKEFQDHLAILRLNNKPTNPISSQLVDELSCALSEIKGTARGLVLCGGDPFFSVGFDLPEVLKFDRPAMSDYFERFNQLVGKFFDKSNGIGKDNITGITGGHYPGGRIKGGEQHVCRSHLSFGQQIEQG